MTNPTEEINTIESRLTILETKHADEISYYATQLRDYRIAVIAILLLNVLAAVAHRLGS